MAVAPIQQIAGTATSTTPSVTLPSSPTVGNTLVAIMSADDYQTASPTAGAGRGYGAARLSSQNNLGFYIWTRVVQSGDSATTTFAIGSATHSAVIVLEIQGTYDKVGTVTTTNNSSAGTQVTSGLSPTTSDNIVLAVFGGTTTNTVLSGFAADNGFTNAISAINPASGAGRANAHVAYKLTGSTAATGTTTISWSGLSSDRSGAQIAFTAASAGPTNYNGTATVAGSGAVSSSGVVGKVASATVAGVAALLSAGTVGISGTAASVAGVGSVTASGVVGVSAGSTISGTGAVQSAGSVGLSTGATISGTGTVTSAGVLGKVAGATLGGVGTIQFAGTVGAAGSGSATIAGTGSVTASGAVAGSRGVTISGVGAISGAGVVGKSSGTTITGLGLITSAGTVVAAGGGSANIIGTATVVATGRVNATSATSISGVAAISAAGSVGSSRGASIAGTGVVSASGVVHGGERDITIRFRGPYDSRVTFVESTTRVTFRAVPTDRIVFHGIEGD